MKELKEDLSHPGSNIAIEYSVATNLFHAELYVRGISYCYGSGDSPEKALAELMENYGEK